MKYQVMPDLTPIEYEALKADIAERGVLVPVEIDETGAVLDGHHRVRAWSELRSEGVNLPDYPRAIRSGLTEEQKRNHARSLNVLRRHLSREQRDEVMRAMRADGSSYEEIATAVGVGYGTAYRATSDVNIQMDIENSRGQVRPASYERRTDPPAIEPDLFASDDVAGSVPDHVNVEDQWGHVETVFVDPEPEPEFDIEPEPTVKTLAWSESELERRKHVESGMTVHANMKTDLALIEWAKENGLFARVDRATEWGNPFYLPTDGDRLTVVENYQWYLDRKPSLLAKLPTLKGKVLGCWCYPEMCHAEVLEEYADDRAD